MPTKPDPPTTVIALVAQIVRCRHQTRHAAILVLCLALALAVTLASVMLVLVLFGAQGAAAVGGVSALSAAGIAVGRIRRARR